MKIKRLPIFPVLLFVLLSTSTLIIYSNTAHANSTCLTIDGALLYGKNYNSTEFIGAITNPFSQQSIANQFGNYGSKFSASSITNEFGNYGSKFSDTSAYNQFATNPPKLVDSNGNFIAHISVNTTLTPRISPYTALACADASFATIEISGTTQVQKNAEAKGKYFSDVVKTTPYYQEIEALARAKWVKGNPDGTFSPHKLINRAEAIALIMSSDVVNMIPEEYNTTCFKDVTANQWYTKSICYLASRGWVKGYSDGTFRPANQVTYGEALKIAITLAVKNKLNEYSPWYKVYFEIAKKSQIPELSKQFNENVTKAEVAMIIFYTVENLYKIKSVVEQ